MIAPRWLATAVVTLVVLFMTFSAAMKLLPIPEVDASFAELGLPVSMRTALGVLELAVTLAYALPRTRRLGVVLLTGYLGGAIVTHWRVAHPWASHTLFPVYLGALAWAGVLLRDPALRVALFAGLPTRVATR